MRKKDKKPALTNQSGQAIVEYILVLVVSIAIAGGALWQFDDAFRSFASSYFGSYLACLLESGELPSFGTSSNGTCSDSFQAFSITNGKPLKGYATIGHASAGGKNGGNAAAGSSSSSSHSTSGSNSGSGTVDANFGRFDNHGRPEVARENKGASGSPDEKGKGDLGFMSGGGPKLVSGTNEQEKKSHLEMGSETLNEQEKKEEARAPTKVADTKQNDLRNKKARVEENRKPAAVNPDDDQEYTIGGFLRWIIIIAIIIALVVFLGGQALQISKGSED